MATAVIAQRYLLGDDAAAADRLRVLDAVYGRSSRALLERMLDECGRGFSAPTFAAKSDAQSGRGAEAPPTFQTALHCADIGCGTGLMTLAMGERVGRGGNVAGVDRADFFVEEARRAAVERGLANAEFFTGDAAEPPLTAGKFHLVYARCVLSHLADPLRVLRAMTRLARPGGVVAVEDIDCGGVFAHPEAPALMRHLEFYQRVLRRHGGDPLMGRKLPRLCRKAGLTDVRFEIVTPAEPQEPVKRLYPLTLACLKPAVVEAKLASPDDVDAIVAELHALANDPTETMSSTPMVQVWSKKP
jgi:ubiquinone/menaquinone biosynthesis C-methylase UbiE